MAVLLVVLVVKYMEIHLVATLLEADHGVLLGIDAVEVLLVMEGLE